MILYHDDRQSKWQNSPYLHQDKYATSDQEY